MNREEIYEAWAPAEATWTVWARPVLFAQLPRVVDEPPISPVDPLKVDWMPPSVAHTAIVADLPGAEAVRMGLAVAERGYRPVPHFNGCTGPFEAVDQKPIMLALIGGVSRLRKCAIKLDAPPAFLLDFNRMSPIRLLQPGVFDNRWMVFPQDFPSSKSLAERQIETVVLVQRGRSRPQGDLGHILRQWQEAGLVIKAKDLDRDFLPERINVPRSPWYGVLWRRLRANFSLHRNKSGGFGGVVPEPSHG